MSFLHSVTVIAAAFLAVFAQAALPGWFHWFGTNLNLLPPLMVYVALRTDLPTLTVAAWVGGLAFDALSLNPLGVSVLPLFALGMAIEWRRELILRDQVFAQIILGLLAGTVAPLLTVVLLLTLGETPMLGWGSLWHLLVLALAGGVAAPLWFVAFDWLQRTLGYQPLVETSFRPDREIRRGRN